MNHGTLVRALTLAIGMLSIPGLDAQNTAPARIDGPWEGAIQVGAGTVRMRVVFTETPTEVRAVIDIPEQGAAGLPLAAVSRADSNIHFELPTPAARAVFDGRLSGNAISGTFAQGQVSGTFQLTRIAPPASAPSVPYVEHEIAVTNGGVRLAGTLTVPRGAGPFPLVVMITGSGPQNRDEEILGFRIFQVIADHLARQGIVTYRYDDRGVGRSTGNIATATTPDFAGDALAALTALKARADIDPRRMGLLGHSEGATVAAIAASRSVDVSFAILLAPPGVRGEDALRQQAIDAARGLGGDDEAVARIDAAHRAVTSALLKNAPSEEIAAAVKELIRAQYDGMPATQRQAIGERDAFAEKAYAAAVAQLQSPWMRFMIDFDHAAPLQEVKCPVLVLFGRLDLQVPPGLNEQPVRKALAGNRAATITVLDRANHLFQAARTGQVSEYATLDKAFVPGFLDQIAAWIARVAAR
jgi:pimeloyl-ACP methyl ester carboxylesterase